LKDEGLKFDNERKIRLAKPIKYKVNRLEEKWNRSFWKYLLYEEERI